MKVKQTFAPGRFIVLSVAYIPWFEQNIRFAPGRETRLPLAELLQVHTN